jgi:hypothetical protein
MSRTAAPLGRPVPAAGARTRTLRELEDAIRAIVPSDEPAVVLSRLARVSTSWFSDACAVELSEGTGNLFRVCFPMPGDSKCKAVAWSAAAGARDSPVITRNISTTFETESGHGYPSFAGMVVHSWAARDPTEDDMIIARLLVDRALALVRHERLALAVGRADRRAAKLAIDVITSRIEGEATGILMAEHHVTHSEAVSLLRRASQAHDRELYEVAVGVVHAADIDGLSHSHAARPERPRLLQAVSCDHPPA